MVLGSRSGSGSSIGAEKPKAFIGALDRLVQDFSRDRDAEFFDRDRDAELRGPEDGEAFPPRDHRVRVLDIACGDGKWVADWVQANEQLVEYVGVDISRAAAAASQVRVGSAGKIFVGDATTAILPRADVIVSKDTLNHMSVELACGWAGPHSPGL